MFCFPTDTPCTPLAPAFFNSQIYSTACWLTYSLTRRLTLLFCPFRSYVRWVAQPCSHQLRLPYFTTTSQCSPPSSLPLLIYGLYASPNNLFNMSYPSPMPLPHYQPMLRLLNLRIPGQSGTLNSQRRCPPWIPSFISPTHTSNLSCSQTSHDGNNTRTSRSPSTGSTLHQDFTGHVRY